MTRFMALFARSQLALIGLIILSLILILAILTPWLPLSLIHISEPTRPY